MIRRSLPALAAAVAVVATAGAPARADLIVSVESVTVLPGSTGNVFDVTVENTGGSAVEIGGFSFTLQADPGIAFTEANTSTALPYIFDGHSLFGPIISVVPPPSGPDLLAADQYDTPNAGISLAAGAMVGLGRVVFDAGGGGIYAVALLDFPATSFSAPDGTDIGVAVRLVSGTIAVVPEPSSVALLGLGLAGAVGLGRRTRGRRSAG